VRIMAPATVIAVVNMKLRFDGLRTSSSLWFNFPVPPAQGHKKLPDSEEKQTTSHRHLVAERFNSSHWSFEETWRKVNCQAINCTSEYPYPGRVQESLEKRKRKKKC
jgi:hypothetical protein